MNYSVIDKCQTKLTGKNVYYAYRSFETEEIAEVWRKENTEVHRSEVVFYPFNEYDIER